jgi:hypothetical protein
LCFNGLDLQADATEFGGDTDVEPQQIQDMRLERHARLEVVELEVDLVDVKRRDVEDDIRFVASCSRLGRTVTQSLGRVPGALDQRRKSLRPQSRA